MMKNILISNDKNKLMIKNIKKYFKY